MISFKGTECSKYCLIPHDLNDYLPKDHLMIFLVEIIDKLDLNPIYSRIGSNHYNPKLLLSLLFY